MEKEIKKILNVLVSNNFDSYLVGGYVRDTLLGIKSYDADICTNALPKDIYKLFNVNNNNYGSVNIKVNGKNIDITTFRKDYNYEGRRPMEVKYVDSLYEDLLRRDFTINTICMDIDGKIIDLLDGVKDLNDRVIRLVGLSDRLKEDPLRILRAIRFSVVLDFEIEDKTLEGIKKYSHLVRGLSKTRLRSELDKILLSKNYKKGLKLLDEFNILNSNYNDVVYVENLLGMYAQLNISNIPFTKIEKKTIIDITEVLNGGVIDNKVLYKYGLYICSIAGKILGISTKSINNLYKKLPIKDLKDLDIASLELSQIVGTGKILGDTQKMLVNLILEGKLKNKKSNIISYLKEV